MEFMEDEGDTNNPWVVWSENNGTGPPQFARISDFHAAFMSANRAPNFKVVDETYNDLFAFLDNERRNTESIFQNNGALIPTFNWLRRMWQTASAMVLYQADGDKEPISNTEFCYMMGRTNLHVFEEGCNQLRQVGSNRSKTWHKPFGRLLKSHWRRKIDAMAISDAVCLSHALMLQLIQDFTEDLEQQHGRINHRTIAETYAMKLAPLHPTLYAVQVFPLFQGGVYGRPTLLIPLVRDEEDE